jgi:hypothetical protein
MAFPMNVAAGYDKTLPAHRRGLCWTKLQGADMSELLTPEHFRPHMEKVFHVQGGHHGLKLTRVEVQSEAITLANGALRQCFNVIFTGPRDDVLREGLYTLEADGGPSFELYVMPIYTPAGGRQDYQATFN